MNVRESRSARKGAIKSEAPHIYASFEMVVLHEGRRSHARGLVFVPIEYKSERYSGYYTMVSRSYTTVQLMPIDKRANSPLPRVQTR